MPIRPAVDAVLTPPIDSPRFAWESVRGATAYTVQISRDPEFVDPALITTSTQRTTAAVLTSYPAAGTYHWRVQAELSSGLASAWSAVRAFEVRGLPPAVLTGPADSFAPEVREVVLDWEPVAGASTYDLQVSTDDAFQSGTTTVAGITGTRYSPPSTYNNDEYYWRVRAVADANNKAPWPATPWHFRRAWSAQPTLQHPLGTVPGDRPFFYQWTAIEMASEYTVYLYRADGTLSCSSPPTVHTVLANVCRPPATGDYQWKVRATDRGSGAVTDVIGQTAATFHYDAPTAPVAGTEALDVDMVTGHAATIDGLSAFGDEPRDACTASLPATCVDLRQTPVLSWDPTPGAVGYRLTISRDRELTNIVPGYSGIAVSSPMWTPDKTLPDSQAGSAYFWVVQPCLGTAASTCAPLEHAKHSFAKKTIAPTLVSPLPQVVDGVLTPPVVGDDVTLDWISELATLRAPGAATDSSLTTPAGTEARSYVVQTATDPSFQTGVIETVTVDQTTFTSFATTYPEGPVYWRVQAIDGSSNPMVWSAPASFVKRSDTPALEAPLPGAALGVDYALSWEPLTFAKAYEVEVYSGATKVAGSTSWKHTSWTPTDPLPVVDGGYTWRVRRIDAKDRKGDWSETRAFTIGALVPATIAPAAGAVVGPSTSYFTWVPEAGATSYRFERRKPGTTSLVENVTTRADSWAPTTAIAAGSWEWRVVTLDAKGAALGASPWTGFSVVDPPAEVTKVTISGSGEVGTELVVSAPVFDPVVDTTTYQWFRGTTAITGATGEVYTVTSVDLGKALTVRGTGTLPGYKPAVSVSEPVTGTAGEALAAVHPPTIDGQRSVGKTLSVTPGVWPESPSLSYQWTRNGTSIPGATRSTYVLTAADAARQIRVVETATQQGRLPGSATSAPVDVARLTSSLTLSLSSTRATVRDRVTATARISVTGLSSPGGSVWFFDGSKKLKTVSVGSGSTAEVRMPRLSAGRHTIKAVYVGGPQVNPSAGTARLTVTRR